MEIQPRSDDALEVGVRLKMANVTSLDCAKTTHQTPLALDSVVNYFILR